MLGRRRSSGSQKALDLSTLTSLSLQLYNQNVGTSFILANFGFLYSLYVSIRREHTVNLCHACAAVDLCICPASRWSLVRIPVAQLCSFPTLLIECAFWSVSPTHSLKALLNFTKLRESVSLNSNNRKYYLYEIPKTRFVLKRSD